MFTEEPSDLPEFDNFVETQQYSDFAVQVK